MNIQIATQFPGNAKHSLVLTYFSKDKASAHPFFSALSSAEKKLVLNYFKNKHFTAKVGETKAILRNGGGKLILFGLGESSKWGLRKAILAARRLVAAAKQEKLGQLNLALSRLSVPGISSEKLAQSLTENAIMANYEFTRYLSLKEPIRELKQLNLLVEAKARDQATAGVAVGLVVGRAVNSARDLGNIPGGEMTPKLLADKAREAGKINKFKVRVLSAADMKILKMGAILGVAKGSAEAPKFIIMEYNGGQRNDKPLVYIGKGVTFDTGGLNLKPGKGMSDMHLDMIGGAAVIAAITAIAQLKLPVNVVGLVPAVENMLGSAGYRPGDLLKSMSGKTIEILNTDAEGRVILADAITYAERYKPTVMIDIATLTGACMVALGLNASGLMTPDSALQEKIMDVGEMSGDYVWPLPMWEEYEDDIKGTFGDIQNDGKNSPYGGAIAGAMFLKQFVGKNLWAHLDIAGPMKTFDGQYLAKGASGVGVRLLVEFARRQVAKK